MSSAAASWARCTTSQNFVSSTAKSCTRTPLGSWVQATERSSEGRLDRAPHELKSMRQQGRHGHRLEDAAGGAAEDELAQARMAIAAHDDEVGRGVRRVQIGR